jgi:hypothetical protein
MNVSAWNAASAIAPSEIWALLLSTLVMLALYVLGKVVLSLFESVVYAGMKPARALRYGLRALVVVVLLMVLFR